MKKLFKMKLQDVLKYWTAKKFWNVYKENATLLAFAEKGINYLILEINQKEKDVEYGFQGLHLTLYHPLPSIIFFKQNFMVAEDMVPDIARLLGVQVHCIPSFSMHAQQINMSLVELCKDNL